MTKEKDIIAAWKFLRENNNSIPDDVLDFMKDSALMRLRRNDKKYDIEFLYWLSTKGEKRAIKEGAVFAGLVRDLPSIYEHLGINNNGKEYCIVKESK